MLIKDIKTEFEKHRILDYNTKKTKIIKKMIDMQYVYGNIYIGKPRKAYDEYFCPAYVVFKEHNIGINVGYWEMYADKAVRKIRDYARKRGTKKSLLKVLNDKFFKDEDFQNDEKNSYDDLPF